MQSKKVPKFCKNLIPSFQSCVGESFLEYYRLYFGIWRFLHSPRDVWLGLPMKVARKIGSDYDKWYHLQQIICSILDCWTQERINEKSHVKYDVLILEVDMSKNLQQPSNPIV